MVNAADFKGDRQRRWMLENRWRSEVMAFADLTLAMGAAEPRSEAKSDLRRRWSEAARTLYERAAELELQMEKAE